MDAVNTLASLCGFTLLLSLLVIVMSLNLAYIARKAISAMSWFSEGFD